MSGNSPVVQDAPTPVSAAPDVNAPDNPNTSAASSTGGGPDVLTQSEPARLFIVRCATVTVCISILAAVAAMCYRVIIDGNAPLTTDITTKLSLIAVGGIVAMVAALFGSNNVLAKIIEKIV